MPLPWQEVILLRLLLDSPSQQRSDNPYKKVLCKIIRKPKEREKSAEVILLGPDARDESKCFLCPKFQSLQHSYCDFHFPKQEIKAQCDYLVFHESVHEEQRLEIQSPISVTAMMMSYQES